MGVRRSFSREGNVDILLILFSLLSMQWRTQYIQWVVSFSGMWWSFLFGAFVTSQFDVILMFPSQRFGEVS